MRALRAWIIRLAGFFGGSRPDRDFTDELDTHLEMHIADNLRSGMTPEEARRAALIKLGGVEQAREEYRDRRSLPVMERLFQDVRFGLRLLAKQPGFTMVAILTLALGIGANTAIFSVVRAVLLKPLPYPSPDRLVTMREYQVGGTDMSVNWLNFLDWRAQNQRFDAMSGYEFAHYTLTGRGDPVLLRAATVSPSFFSIFGAQPLWGRVLNADDDKIGAPATVVLSDELWQSRFGADPGVIGRIVALDGNAYTVVGVLGSGFRDPELSGIDLYTALAPLAVRWRSRDDRGSLTVLGRLKPGVTVAAARSEMDTIEGRLEQQFPKTNHGVRASVTSLYNDRFGSLRPVLLTLLAAVGVVLLIACANVANMSMARSLVRRREFAVRAAAGASRARLMTQLLVEATLLGCLGGAAGLLPAWWGVDLMIRLAPPGIPRLAETRVDGTVLLFTWLISMLTGLVAGIGPAIEASRLDVAEVVKENGVQGGRSSHRWLHAFVLGEVALAVVLALASGLLVRSLIKTERVDPGFDPEHLLAVEVVLPSSGYAAPAQILAFSDATLARMRTLPGVRSADLVLCPPAVGHCWDWFYTVEGQLTPDPGKLPVAAFNQVGPHYFSTLGVPLVVGRPFTGTDTPTSPPVVIVNQTFARQWWPNSNPIGKQIRLWAANGGTPPREIVGVAADIKEDGLDADSIPEVFIPFAQRPSNGITFMLRTGGNPANLIRPATEAVNSVDKNLPIQRVRPMTEYLDNSIAQRKFAALLTALFGLLAMLLAAIGIYGVTSYSVSQRTHEIGIRMALGAGRTELLGVVARQGLRLAGAGIAIGIVAALGVTRLMTSLLFGISPSDLATFGSVALLLVAVALFATYVPARRATKVDPMIALRTE